MIGTELARDENISRWQAQPPPTTTRPSSMDASTRRRSAIPMPSTGCSDTLTVEFAGDRTADTGFYSGFVTVTCGIATYDVPFLAAVNR